VGHRRRVRTQSPMSAIGRKQTLTLKRPQLIVDKPLPSNIEAYDAVREQSLRQRPNFCQKSAIASVREAANRSNLTGRIFHVGRVQPSRENYI